MDSPNQETSVLVLQLDHLTRHQGPVDHLLVHQEVRKTARISKLVLELPDQAVLDVAGRQAQLRQSADDHLEEEIGHIGARAADEEADPEETGEEHARGDGGAGLGEVDDGQDAAGGVLLGGPGHAEAFVAPVSPVGEDEVVAGGIDRVADELAETFWPVDVSEAGDVWLDADLSLGDGHGVSFLSEGE